MAQQYGASSAGLQLPDPDALALSNALELDAIRTVVLREAHVGRLSQLCFKYAAASAAVKQAAKLPRHRRELQRVLDSLRMELQASVDMLRAASLAVAETIMSWQAAATDAGLGIVPKNAYGVPIGPPGPPTFVWRGQNYVQKMCSDVAAITEATRTPLAAITGVDPRSNPLLEVGPEVPPAAVGALAEAAVRERAGIMERLHEHDDGATDRRGSTGGGSRRRSAGGASNSSPPSRQSRHSRRQRGGGGREAGPPDEVTIEGGGYGSSSGPSSARYAAVGAAVEAEAGAEAEAEVRRAHLAAGVRADLVASAIAQQYGLGGNEDESEVDARWASRAAPPPLAAPPQPAGPVSHDSAAAMPFQHGRSGSASGGLRPLQQRPVLPPAALQGSASTSALERAPTSARLLLAPLQPLASAAPLTDHAPAASPSPRLPPSQQQQQQPAPTGGAAHHAAAAAPQPQPSLAQAQGGRTGLDDDDAALLARLHRIRSSLLQAPPAAAAGGGSGAFPVSSVAQARRAHVLSLLAPHPPSAAATPADGDSGRLAEVDAAIAALEGNEQRWEQAVGRLQQQHAPPEPQAQQAPPQAPPQQQAQQQLSAPAAASVPPAAAAGGKVRESAREGGAAAAPLPSTRAPAQQSTRAPAAPEASSRRAALTEPPTPQQVAAATAIQATARGRLDRARLARQRAEALAAVEIQRAARGLAARREVRPVILANREARRKHKAATAIQRVARGRAARRRVGGLVRIAELSAQCSRLHAALRPDGLVSLAALLSALDAGYQRAQAVSSQLMHAPTSASAAVAAATTHVMAEEDAAAVDSLRRPLYLLLRAVVTLACSAAPPAPPGTAEEDAAAIAALPSFLAAQQVAAVAVHGGGWWLAGRMGALTAPDRSALREAGCLSIPAAALAAASACLLDSCMAASAIRRPATAAALLAQQDAAIAEASAAVGRASSPESRARRGSGAGLAPSEADSAAAVAAANISAARPKGWLGALWDANVRLTPADLRTATAALAWCGVVIRISELAATCIPRGDRDRATAALTRASALLEQQPSSPPQEAVDEGSPEAEALQSMEAEQMQPVPGLLRHVLGVLPTVRHYHVGAKTEVDLAGLVGHVEALLGGSSASPALPGMPGYEGGARRPVILAIGWDVPSAAALRIVRTVLGFAGGDFMEVAEAAPAHPQSLAKRVLPVITSGHSAVVRVAMGAGRSSQDAALEVRLWADVSLGKSDRL